MMAHVSDGAPRRVTATAWLIGTLLIASVSTVGSGLVAAQETATAPAAHSEDSPGARSMTAEDLEAFLDGLVPAQIAHDDIAGAVVLMVRDGAMFFAKGYGYADAEQKTPVSPGTTLFRPGSISKLFVWTAVMQQVEQGKLDLDRDVNTYLDFAIPATFPEPITLRHILTHTPGFEESVKDLFVPSESTLQPLGDYLVTHLPRRIFPPGVTPAYSNYGTALAGYIVQRVSGVPLEEYLERFIFTPLQMTRSTFRQPLPDALAPLMSKGYRLASDGAKSFEMVQAWPAGSMSTSAEDLSRFMLAHLQEGRLGDAVILRPETARLMHARQFARHDAQPGMALGFYEETSHGHRIIGHGGDTAYFHSDLHLMPDAGLGFFISYNGAGRGQTGGRGQVWKAVLDRYFPAEPGDAAAVPTAEADASAVSGGYIVSRRGEGSFIRMTALLGQLEVSAHDKGELELSSSLGPNGKPLRWQPVARDLYREAGGHRTIAFRRDEAGRLELVPMFPFMTARRAAWYEHRLALTIGLGASVALFALTVLGWPLTAWLRRHYGASLPLAPGARRIRLWVRLAVIANLLVVAGWVAFAMRMGEIGNANSGVDWAVLLLQAAGWISIPAAAVCVLNGWRSVADRDRWWGSRIHDAVLAVAGVVFALLLWWVGGLTLTTRW
jgi:CubicO group peptidase (beta-lactamase class C family)